MKNYRFNQGEIQIPETWKDQTVHCFSVPGNKGGGTASFVMTRDADTPAKDVQNYVDVQMVEAAKNLQGFKPVDRRAIVLSGQPAVELTYTWITPEKMTVQHRQVCLQQDKVFLIITMTAKVADFPKHEEAWNAAIQSLRLR